MNKILACAVALAGSVMCGQVAAETQVSTKGGLKVTSGEHTVQFGGRIQYDYYQTELNGETVDDQFDLRRGRVFVKGNVSPDWHFKVNYNVNGSGTEDMYIGYKGWGKMAELTVGKQHMPFTLEQLISSKNIAIIERSAITERYLIGRRDGIQLQGNASTFHYSVGAFTEEDGKNTEEQTAFAARVAYLPYKADSSLVHLGASYKDVGDVSGSGLELAATAGAFYFQSEFFQQEDSETNEDIDGFYAQIAYTLTGETRGYKKGGFSRIKPSSPKGAWEIAARYESGDGKYSDIELGSIDADAFALGVNYYANNNLKISMSYSQGEAADKNESGSNDEGKELRASMLLAF